MMVRKSHDSSPVVCKSHDGSHASDEELSEEVPQNPARVFYSQTAANTFINQIGTLFDTKIGRLSDKIDALTDSITELVHILGSEQEKKPTLAPALVPPEPEPEPERSSTFMEFPPVSMPRYTSQDARSGTFAVNINASRQSQSPV